MHFSFLGNYMYVDASFGQEGDSAVLASPMKSVNGTGCLKFAVHIVGDHIGSLEVYVMDEFKDFHR